MSVASNTEVAASNADVAPMRVRVGVLAALLCLVGGCSAFAPRLEKPTLKVVNVALVKSDLFEQRLKARMRVQNPNDRSLSVRRIDYTIEVGGEEFGRGLTGGSFVVPALGEAEFDMTITANMAGTLLRLATKAQKAGGGMPDTIDYRIVGTVSLAEGLLRTIPFEDRGTFNLR